MKCQSFTPSVCEDLRIGKLKFVAKAQFFFIKLLNLGNKKIEDWEECQDFSKRAELQVGIFDELGMENLKKKYDFYPAMYGT